VKTVSAMSGFVLVIGLMACSSSNQEKAKEQAREDVRTTTAEAKKAGHEIKENVKELNRRAETAMQHDGGSASDKMSHAEAKAKDAASHAGVELDHAAMLARVKTKLASDVGLSTLAHVDVAVDGGVVTLSGTVANEDQKKATEAAASQVTGVTQVRNRLAVQP
jgi:osmotically-inducible protein OsmY